MVRPTDSLRQGRLPSLESADRTGDPCTHAAQRCTYSCAIGLNRPGNGFFAAASRRDVEYEYGCGYGDRSMYEGGYENGPFRPCVSVDALVPGGPDLDDLRARRDGCSR
jgi:hypothetical protein